MITLHTVDNLYRHGDAKCHLIDKFYRDWLIFKAHDYDYSGTTEFEWDRDMEKVEVRCSPLVR